MGRKGVSKRKKSKVKKEVAPSSGSISALTERKTGFQPELVAEKDKPAAKKGKKKR